MQAGIEGSRSGMRFTPASANLGELDFPRLPLCALPVEHCVVQEPGYTYD